MINIRAHHPDRTDGGPDLRADHGARIPVPATGVRASGDAGIASPRSPFGRGGDGRRPGHALADLLDFRNGRSSRCWSNGLQGSQWGGSSIEF